MCVTTSRDRRTHDIGLSTDGDQTVDVFLDGHKHLSGHVSALLGSRGLILNVNTSSTLLDEHLGKLHDGGQTTVAGISIGDDGAKEVGGGKLGALRFGNSKALFTLLPVVEELREPEMLDFVGDGSLRESAWLTCFFDWFCSPWGSLQDLGRARRWTRQWTSIASQRRILCRDIWPFA